GALAALRGGGSPPFGGGGPGQRPPTVPPAPPGFGSGGRGPGGSFNGPTPPTTAGAPASGLPDLDETRGRRPRPTTGSSGTIRANLCPASDEGCYGGGSSDPPGNDPDFSTERLRPLNETGDEGVNPGSRNFNWSLPLVSLPGRAGLDLNLALYYNSLVWTRQGMSIQYNADMGFPAPGFRLGFPTLHRQFVNQLTGATSFLLVTPAGGRVELKRVGTSNVYEAADGSYTQLTDNGPASGAVVKLTDGTQLTFGPLNESQLRCTQIKDRNGNYLSIAYHTSGLLNGSINTVTDTLGRIVTFNYYADGNLEKITQLWGGGVTYNWARFEYGSPYVQTNFRDASGTPLTVYGPNGSNVTVLTRVRLADDSSYYFDYTIWGQVYQIRRHAPDGHLLAKTFYNLSGEITTPQTDCPRFTYRADMAENWIGGAWAYTAYSVTENAAWTMPTDGSQHTGTLTQVTAPDGTVFRQYAKATGWQNGLPMLSETWVGPLDNSANRKKWTATVWTQDDTNLSYPLNPRPTELTVGDAEGNRRRTTIEYSGYSLPQNVREYGGTNGDQLLRRTESHYRWDDAYLSRRIIGLPNVRLVYEGSGPLVSKVEYHYDWRDGYMQAQAPSVGHDGAGYGSTLDYGRGFVVGVRRYNVNAPDDPNQAVWAQFNGYDLAGSTVWTEDASGHRTNLSYADSFSDGNNGRNTRAYPTIATDAGGYSSTVQYNFDTGATTRTQDPKGAAQVLAYDSIGRLDRVTNQVNGAYRRWVYWTDGLQTLSYETIQAGAGEFYANTVTDGAGRVRASAADHPTSYGGFRGQSVTYDPMGRVTERTNPAEMTSSWTPTGDDTVWVKTLQAYDWQGRPTLTTNPDSTTRELSYTGCGCAGGEVTTARDERGRRRRLYNDSLGRLWKVEELEFTQALYATTTYAYNARDQLTQSSQSGQTRTFEYDGHGRLWRKTTPEQGPTTYLYNADDTVQSVTDARGAAASYSYNSRHLPASINYTVPGGVAQTPNVTFTYDEAG
ncbi:MAG: RHS repeat domain-containing protein, partial [Pyrinomonadaceae bacterium]